MNGSAHLEAPPLAMIHRVCRLVGWLVVAAMTAASAYLEAPPLVVVAVVLSRCVVSAWLDIYWKAENDLYLLPGAMCLMGVLDVDSRAEFLVYVLGPVYHVSGIATLFASMTYMASVPDQNQSWSRSGIVMACSMVVFEWGGWIAGVRQVLPETMARLLNKAVLQSDANGTRIATATSDVNGKDD
jgi:hypothetical protein